MRPLLFLLLALLLATGGAGQAQPEPETIDSVLVEKAARRLSLLDAHGRAVRVFEHIQLGFAPVGAKHFEGDGRTPEGRYVIDYGNRDSAYHLSLHVSYPDSGDVAFARAQGHSPGGAIFLHGQPNALAERPAGDWTNGCVALSNSEIDEIWSLVGDGTPILIRP
jgi:murein L,D-transpeptidase YafK